MGAAGECHGKMRYLARHAGRSAVRRELDVIESESAILMGQLVWDASQRRDQTAWRRLGVRTRAARELRPWRQEPMVQDGYDRLLDLTAV